jgi:hypothetical protein
MSTHNNDENTLKIISDFIQSKKQPEFDCEACRIEHYDEQVKQKSRHTCGIDGPNDDIDRIKSGKKKNDSPNSDPHEAEVRRIAEVLAKVLHPTAFSE